VIASRTQSVAIFVNRSAEGWIVRDPAGDYWLVPSCEGGWGLRQPFDPADGADLESVPGHYRSMLDLPF
jgi:hypothetical protein